MVRLEKLYKDRIPKGNFREVQKQVNIMLKDACLHQDFYGNKGLTEKDFDYDISVYEDYCIISVYCVLPPPTNYEQLKELYVTLNKYYYRNIKHKFEFDKKDYVIEFPSKKVFFKKKAKTQKSRKLSHKSVANLVDNLCQKFYKMKNKVHCTYSKILYL